MEPLLRYPIFFVIAGALLVAGALWMRKIVDFDF
jgi:Flp pilus assembly protein TadB